MTEEPELKPCPFCGGVASIHDRMHGGWIAFCNKCLTTSAINETKEQLIAAWNQRAEPEYLPGWVIEKLNRFLDNYSLGAGSWKTHWDDAVEWVLSLKRGE